MMKWQIEIYKRGTKLHLSQKLQSKTPIIAIKVWLVIKLKCSISLVEVIWWLCRGNPNANQYWNNFWSTIELMKLAKNYSVDLKDEGS